MLDSLLSWEPYQSLSFGASFAALLYTWLTHKIRRVRPDGEIRCRNTNVRL